jgi:hypothetical protein
MFGFQIQIIEGLGWLDSRLLTETKSPSLYKLQHQLIVSATARIRNQLKPGNEIANSMSI